MTLSSATPSRREAAIRWGGYNMSGTLFERNLVEKALREVVSYIWATSLEMELTPVTSTTPPSAPWSGIEASVHIMGAWCGTLKIQTSRRLAEDITARMYEISDRSKLNWEQIQDALREITNVTGGNLKTVLPEECQLGIPQTVEMEISGIETTTCQTALGILFRSAGQPFQVILEGMQA